jgi:hypothetical protein
MLQPSQMSRLAELIRKNETIKTVEYEDKHYTDLIDMKWVFVLIAAIEAPNGLCGNGRGYRCILSFRT